jgi:hypothetical protein
MRTTRVRRVVSWFSQHVRRLHVLVVGEWQAVAGQRLLDVLLELSAELHILTAIFEARRPSRIALRRDGAGRRSSATPAGRRHIIKRVPEEVHVTALHTAFAQDIPDRGLEARVIVRDNELDAGKPGFLRPRRKSRQLAQLSRLASTTAMIWAGLPRPPRQR